MEIQAHESIDWHAIGQSFMDVFHWAYNHSDCIWAGADVVGGVLALVGGIASAIGSGGLSAPVSYGLASAGVLALGSLPSALKACR
jgi:hypothetical protein